MTQNILDDRLAKLRADYPPSYDHGITHLKTLLAELGHPHLSMPPVFHVAGTNGKGSTLAFIQSIFEASNLSVHKYTSPHLIDFEERIVLNGAPIDRQELLDLIDEVDEKATGRLVSFFEIITAIAFVAFSKHTADVVLLEVGLGGLYDATNVIEDPICTIITKLSYDHTQVLGSRLEDIALQKLGIVKQDIPLVVAPQNNDSLTAFMRAEVTKTSAVTFVWRKDINIDHAQKAFTYKDIILPLPQLSGDHQIENAVTAIEAVSQTTFAPLLTQETLTRAMHRVTWAGRLQQITSGALADILPHGVELWVDGAHNDSGASALRDYVRQNMSDKPLYLLTAFKAKKDVESFFDHMADVADRIYVVDFPIEVDMTPYADIAKILSTHHDKESDCVKGIMAAVRTCAFQFENPCRIMITGSLYLVGHALKVNKT